MEEIWKDIKNYEWFYKISNFWKVKSLKTNRILSLNTKNNYWHIYINFNHKWIRKHLYIHRLVAQAFLWLDINNNKMLVCHKDDNPANNNVENLFLWTHKDNVQDMIKKNRHKWLLDNIFNYNQVTKMLYTKYKEWKIIILD